MMTQEQYKQAKYDKISYISFIAAETIAQYIICNRKDNKYLMTRDNAGFGDKRKWCLRFMNIKTGGSTILQLNEKQPHNCAAQVQEQLPKLLEKIENIL